jgi:hypothetical protein
VSRKKSLDSITVQEKNLRFQSEFGREAHLYHKFSEIPSYLLEFTKILLLTEFRKCPSFT